MTFNFLKNKIIWVVVLLIAVLTAAIFIFLTFNKKTIEFSVIPNLDASQKKESQWQEIKPIGEYWTGRDAQILVVFKNKVWLSGGVSGGKVTPPPVYENITHPSDLWVSTDLLNWEKITDNVLWGERRSVAAVVFKDKIWLYGGWEKKYGDTKNDIWNSENGTDWKKISLAKWAPREGNAIVEFKGKLWMAGGVDFFAKKTFNDVWYSEDGIKWVEAVKTAPWSERYDHTLTVFDDKLWIIGGYSSKSGVKGDVWSSIDGINWTLVLDNPPFSARHGHLCFDYNGMLWIIGGWCEEEDKGLNDTWFSKDGKAWEKLEGKTPWAGREDHGGIIFNNKIIMMGGMADEGKVWEWKNDIWELNL